MNIEPTAVEALDRKRKNIHHVFGTPEARALLKQLMDEMEPRLEPTDRDQAYMLGQYVVLRDLYRMVTEDIIHE